MARGRFLTSKARQIVGPGVTALTLIAGIGLALAQNGAGIGGGPGPVGELQSAGLTLDRIEIRLEGTTGTSQRDQALRQKVLRTLGVRSGDQWNTLLVGQAVARVRTLPGI